ncbi:putative DUF21 domain-containing protein At1g03270 [Primulina huaijiensis]|uniref:putative DUF21 domain-containing protein At1g03270 n=1 Tax=Primulina huaijiensis TaxID=1492673 RepID=UPI003CC79330
MKAGINFPWPVLVRFRLKEKNTSHFHCTTTKGQYHVGSALLSTTPCCFRLHRGSFAPSILGFVLVLFLSCLYDFYSCFVFACHKFYLQALPIYLDKIFHPAVAVILSVTFVLAFGEIIPQAVCSRYGLPVGANCVWLVRVLIMICFPIAYPIGKILDSVLGRLGPPRCFVQATSIESTGIYPWPGGNGGELTNNETTIISGALNLTEKTAEKAMTPIESTFSLDVSSKLDWRTATRGDLC